MPKLVTATAVLLYPDYLAGDYGADTFVDSASAPSLPAVVEIVQARAAAFASRETGHTISPDDFRMILVIKGKPEILGDATGLYSTGDDS